MAGGPDAADRALEQGVAGEYVGPVDKQRHHAGGMAGSVQGFDVQGAAVDRLARHEIAGRGGDIPALEGVDEHRGLRVEVHQPREFGYVIVVVVRQQDVRELEAHPAQDVQQRLDRPAGVDDRRL